MVATRLPHGFGKNWLSFCKEGEDTTLSAEWNELRERGVKTGHKDLEEVRTDRMCFSRRASLEFKNRHIFTGVGRGSEGSR